MYLMVKKLIANKLCVYNSAPLGLFESVLDLWCCSFISQAPRGSSHPRPGEMLLGSLVLRGGQWYVHP